MLTIIKEIFTWWNRQTLGTRIFTTFFGKFVGKDEYGNKYYESKKGRRWVIYNGEVEASKIPNEWYSWIHFTKNKIENLSQFKSIKTITVSYNNNIEEIQFYGDYSIFAESLLFNNIKISSNEKCLIRSTK